MNLATAKYGMPAAGPTGPATAPPPAASNGALTTGAAGKLVDDPAVWLVGLAAVMLGLIGVNSSLRVGPLHGEIGVGKV